jgi:hypothetical protein
MEMRKLTFACKYRALADSAVELDSQKSAADLRADFLFVVGTKLNRRREPYH